METAMDVLAWMMTGKKNYLTTLFIRKSGKTTRMITLSY